MSIDGKEQTYGDVEVEKVIRIYDGDTYYVNLKNVHPIIGKNIGIRLRGIDTPELKTGCSKLLALKAKEFVAEKFKNAKLIQIKNISRDKYFRIDADVFVDSLDLSKELINAGFAKSYDGGTKTIWECDK
ncbi:MAG TPA: nuclease [Flavobacterium sp.]|nr:nuclease [Flavobacterium sp.]